MGEVRHVPACAHTDYYFRGPKAGFDIFLFQGGKIVEHWDNLQEPPGTPNPGGHAMFDGATAAIDPAKTDENNGSLGASSRT